MTQTHPTASPAFEAAFRELSSARRAYEDVDRTPERIPPLAQAHLRLANARDVINRVLVAA